MGHSSTKVGLEPGSIGKEPDADAVLWVEPPETERQGQEALVGHGIVVARAGSTAMDQTTFVVGAGSPPELKARSPIACTASSGR